MFFTTWATAPAPILNKIKHTHGLILFKDLDLWLNFYN
jgi:hypothetical protein